MLHVNLELFLTKRDVVSVVAVHRHDGADPRYCIGWTRVGPGHWRQRHMMAYGNTCKVCLLKMPTNKELDVKYDEQAKVGLDKLEII